MYTYEVEVSSVEKLFEIAKKINRELTILPKDEFGSNRIEFCGGLYREWIWKSQLRSMKMKLDIPMKRVKVTDIASTYNKIFLENHNFFNGPIVFCNIRFEAIVRTKYGYLAVNRLDNITYVGNGIWSVEKYENNW